MTSSKRDLTDFKNYPGEINEITNNYEMPTLFKKTENGQLRKWNLYVRLIKKASKSKSILGSDWNVLVEEQIPIKPEYLEIGYILDQGILSQVWTECGMIEGKITRHSPTYPIAKNIGRTNERNVLQQALVQAHSKYLKKLEEGSIPNESLANEPQSLLQNQGDKKYFPTLAKNFKDCKNIEYPVFIQPKLDGVRCVAFLDSNSSKTSWKNVMLYSRQKKDYIGYEQIRKTLFPILEKYYDKEAKESIYLDGELYQHGKKLQQISGEARDTKSSKEENQYYLYDMFYPSRNTEFQNRFKMLEHLYNDAVLPHVQLVETILVENQMKNDTLYHHYLDAGYEGTMIRNPYGIYLTHPTKKSTTLRSKDLLKRKEVFEDEFEVVNYKEGEKGRDIKAVIWICQTPEKRIFDVVPVGITYEERYELWKECNMCDGKGFVDTFKNRLLNVEYRGLSADNIPQHAKSKGFRDFK